MAKAAPGKKKQKKSLDYYKIPGTNKTLRPWNGTPTHWNRWYGNKTEGDCVRLRPPEPATPQYIARIERIESDAHERISLRCRWYYRPEESLGGRRQFHGSKELFLSDHFDSCSPDAVEGFCSVLPFKEYTRLDKVGEEDFFCRFEYKASSGTFSPDRVAVYCKCEMPYNPDDLMIQCEHCKDWFHPNCVKLTKEQIRKMAGYTCSDCQTATQGSTPPKALAGEKMGAGNATSGGRRG
eukprot:TRINITY_DN29992_c0_g1_i1.p1 TRINITY_DN29992_c0_g1~~TRINITY_DN29992_c0_g1_i1.p1  ORF type:complete len:238 (-),score=26.52 TRINITY_DN29992_c0_g1_i1:949-1662(-)